MHYKRKIQHALIPMVLLPMLIGMEACCTWEDRFTQEFDCNPEFASVDTTINLSTIAFGSCADQDDDQPLLNDASASNADLFIFLGDNVYIDSRDCSDFFSEYSKLACKSEFAELVMHTPTVAVWDDHDYGENDSGMDYPMREVSKDVFLRFWNEPLQSARRKHDGIYHSHRFGDSAHRVQVILLDMRSFRSPLTEQNDEYLADNDPTRSFLGAAQWAWLEEQLLLDARVRIIASSTQFGIEHNGWEAWANFPLEQQRMADVIARTQANGVVFLSGDVHYSELSRHQFPGCYPIYDCTASGITQVEDGAAPNQYRVGEAVVAQNFGHLAIDWMANPVQLTYTIRTAGGTIAYSHAFGLDEISF